MGFELTTGRSRVSCCTGNPVFFSAKSIVSYSWATRSLHIAWGRACTEPYILCSPNKMCWPGSVNFRQGRALEVRSSKRGNLQIRKTGTREGKTFSQGCTHSSLSYKSRGNSPGILVLNPMLFIGSILDFFPRDHLSPAA